MNKFIFKLFLLILTIIILYSSGVYFLKNNLKNEILKSDSLILGDSHTMFINLPKSFNYSNYGFPYIIHYNFINEFKEIIKNKRVFLVYSHNNISKEFQNRFDDNNLKPNWLSMVNQNLNSFSLLPNKYYKQYEWYNPYAGIFNKSKFDKLTLKNNINTSKVSTDTILFSKKIIEHYTDLKYVNDDTIQLEYLFKTINILKKNNCEIILINTPKTKYYTNNIPSKIIEKYERILKKLNLKYLELNAILNKELDPSCFMDADHTNAKGDLIINNYLKNNDTLFSPIR